MERVRKHQSTGEGTLALLRMMFLEEMSIAGSVRAPMNRVGADPDYGSALGYYLDDKGNATISQLFRSYHVESEGETTYGYFASGTFVVFPKTLSYDLIVAFSLSPTRVEPGASEERKGGSQFLRFFQTTRVLTAPASASRPR